MSENSNMESFKETISEPKFRIKQIEVQEEWVLNTITITYDEESVWSYGPGWSKESAKTVVFTENEYLVRVTHEGLENRKYAGVALELETNKGRVFSFESKCADLPKDKRTTVRADPGMEIVMLKIKLGELVGFKQQPCPKDEGQVDAKAQWYSILYYGIKEEEDEKIEKKEFKDKLEADVWWKEVSEKSKKKQGRGALYLNTKTNKIMKKIGSRDTTAKLESEAGTQGVYVNMAGEDLEVDLAAVLPVLYKALPNPKDGLLIAIMFVFMVFGDSLNLESMRITGKLVSFLSGSTIAPNETMYESLLCNTVLQCGEDSRYDYGASMMITFIFMILLERAVDFGYEIIRSTSQTKFEEPLKNSVNEKALSLDQAYHDSHSYGEILSKCDPYAVASLITYDIPNIVRSCIRLVTVGYYLARIRPVLAGAVLIFTIVSEQFVFLPMAKRWLKLYFRRNIFYGLAGDLEYEAYSLISTIKQCSTEKFHLAAHKKAADKILQTSRTLLLEDLKNDFVFRIFDNVMIIGAMFYEITMSDSNAGAGEFMTIYLFIGQFSGIFANLAGRFKNIRRTLAKVEKYEDFMTTPVKVVSGTEPVGNLTLTGDIKFEGVQFTYPSRSGEKILSGLDLTLKSNKMTAIVGESGSGKSTIAKLLMRQYDPDEGKITLAGKDFRSFDLADLHSKMAIVSQNSELMSATLSDNIGYEKGSSDPIIKARITDSAKLARCNFIDKFRSGLETYAGSKGLMLSGGQQQRISIARAAMRDPEILILDEATSSLDALTESEIQKSLNQLMMNKTTIVIAHRLSTIRDADVILCMKDGKVVESGTHEQLTTLKGYYHSLTSKQLVMDTKDKIENASDMKKIAEIMDDVSQSIKQVCDETGVSEVEGKKSQGESSQSVQGQGDTAEEKESLQSVQGQVYTEAEKESLQSVQDQGDTEAELVEESSQSVQGQGDTEAKTESSQIKHVKTERDKESITNEADTQIPLVDGS